jgi:hypothetical protein
MASYQFNVQALNDIVVDYGGAGGHTFTLSALNAWAVLLGGSGGHTFSLDAANEFAELVGGAGDQAQLYAHSYPLPEPRSSTVRQS